MMIPAVDKFDRFPATLRLRHFCNIIGRFEDNLRDNAKFCPEMILVKL